MSCFLTISCDKCGEYVPVLQPGVIKHSYNMLNIIEARLDRRLSVHSRPQNYNSRPTECAAVNCL